MILWFGSEGKVSGQIWRCKIEDVLKSKHDFLVSDCLKVLRLQVEGLHYENDLGIWRQ